VRPWAPCWAEVDLSAIEHNVAHIRRLVGPKVRFMAVVKADAYGHGAVPVARAALRAGAEFLGVAIVAEAVQLREAGITSPILVLGPCLPEEAAAVVAHGLTQTVCDEALPERLSRAAQTAGREVAIHVKVDTGMGRLGVACARAVEYVERIASLRGLRVEGVFSHFATADEEDLGFAQVQLARLYDCCSALERAGFTGLVRHIANSGGVLNLADSYLDLVRPGLLMYGIGLPCPTRLTVDVRPALAWKTKVGFVRRAEAGETIGYGRTYTVPRSTTVAALPVGYADGYDRRLSNKGDVLIAGKRAPVLGRVSMDRIVVDVGHIPGVAVGHEAVLLGRQGDEQITALELAVRVDTTVHEITTRIGPRVTRLYV
jgi:alanine racemase